MIEIAKAIKEFQLLGFFVAERTIEDKYWNAFRAYHNDYVIIFKIINGCKSVHYKNITSQEMVEFDVFYNGLSEELQAGLLYHLDLFT